MSEVIKNRYEFVYLFDVENGNPNGDPDAGNMPRIDPETNHGIITDVCLKRKIRNFVSVVKNEGARFKIFVKEKAVLNTLIEEPYYTSDNVKDAVKAWDLWKKDKKKNPKPKEHFDDVAKDWMCDNYFDIRSFGAVLTTGEEKKMEGIKSKIRMTAGQVTGPVQLNFARSMEPILPLEITITRMAVATEAEAKAQKGDNRTMGRKHIVPYGLYRAEGYISANLAQKTGFSEDDLELLWKSLINMFDHDHSAARGKMNARKLVVFKHDSALGNAPAHVLFDLVKVEPNHEGRPARAFTDYKITVNKNAPAGVEVIEKIEKT